MNYAIIRTAKLKTMGNIAASGQHNFRERLTENADPARTHLNKTVGAESSEKLVEAVKERLATVKTVRKNAVLALEYFVGASPEWFAEQTPEAREAYFDDAEKWLKERHGAENVVGMTRQYDETSPHICAYVVPIDPKGKLNAAHFQDGRQKMHALQTDFAADVGKSHGLERGIEGSKAEHVSIKKHYSLVNEPFEPLPEVVTKLPPKLPPEPVKPGLLAGSAAKDKYELARQGWDLKQAEWEAQRKAHIAERKAERDAAVATAKRHQAQAREAAALKTEVRQLKRANGDYAKRIAKLLHLQAMVDLFTPGEIKLATDRKLKKEADLVQQSRLAKLKEFIAKEVVRRIEAIPGLLSRGGVEHTFAVAASTALREANHDASKADWERVELKTAVRAIGSNRQKPETVTDALAKHSPARADPASHEGLRQLIQVNLPQIEALRQKNEQEKSQGKGLTP